MKFKRIISFIALSFIPITSGEIFANSEYVQNKILTTETLQQENKKTNLSDDVNNQYLLGPGDELFIEIFGLPELSGIFTISPNGMIYMKQIKELYASKITISELKNKIKNSYDEFLINPEISIALTRSRPVRVYIQGEVKKPGFYTLNTASSNYTIGAVQDIASSTDQTDSGLLFPTLFDALKASQGITPYSDLTDVKVTRDLSLSNGGGRAQTSLNFLTLFQTGEQFQNIRIMDGDTISVKKSEISLKEQLLEVNRSNMNPDSVTVFISGQVRSPGAVTLPKGSGLNQAIAYTGGKQLLSGRVEFVRFQQDGEADRKLFSYDPNSILDSKTNPILADGDIINVYDSLLSRTGAVISKLLQPVAPTFFLLELLDLR